MKNAFLGISLLVALCACKNEVKKPVAAPPVATPTAPTPTPTPTPTPAPTAAITPATPAPVTQTTCYQLVTKTKDVYSCQISQDAKGISGYYDWAPNQKDGGHGILRNAKKIGKDTLSAEFLYMIEGSTQMEEKYFVMTADKLVELNGELTEVKGSNPIKLVLKDKKKLKPDAVLPKVDCAKVAAVVKSIQSMGLK
jgi:hypothetical protein